MFVLALPLSAGFQFLHHRGLCRRPVGGDRDGDRGIGRARHHGVERSHRPAGAAAARAPAHRRADVGALLLTVRRVAIFVILILAYLYYRLGRRGAARRDRPSVLRGGGAARAGLFRRPDLAAGHRARRDRRAWSSASCVWAYTLLLPNLADAGFLGTAILTRRAVGPRAACVRKRCSGWICRRWRTACSGAWRSISLPISAFSLGRAPAPIERMQADLFVPSESHAGRRVSGCGARRSRSRN